MKHDMLKPTQEKPCGVINREGKAHDRAPFCGTDCGSATVDVLALITPNAATWLGNTYGGFSGWWIYQTTHNMNTALINSSVWSRNIRVRAINFTPSFSLGTTTDVAVSGMNSSAQIAQLKNQFRADIVVLLTRENFSDAYGVVNTLNPDDAQKNTVVEIDFADETRFTLAHELAHLLGAGHDQANAGFESCAMAHNLLLSGNITRKTILATGAANYNPQTPSQVNKTRIQHYSNPDINFSGLATGTTQRNNASIIRGSFCNVANNMPNPSLEITGISCTGLTYKSLAATLYQPQLANTAGIPVGIQGVGPYVFKWEVASSYSGPYQLIANSNSLSINVSVGSTQVKYLRFTVTASDGYVLSREKAIYGGYNHGLANGNGDNTIIGEVAKISKINNSDQLSFYPNPANDQLQILIPQRGVESIKNVEIIGQQGNLIYQISTITEDMTLYISNFGSGLYFLKYSLGDRLITEKIIINH
jgi:hypothetical protein